ncbi:MAG: carboxylesterase family protein [Oscillospiraceae bacterium]|nr:carboxylesterase family protein [Oscillospiraceae bacterium]
MDLEDNENMAGFWIAFVLALLLMLAALELNKNSLTGFILCLGAAGAFARFHWAVHAPGLRVLGWLVWIAVFAAVLLLTWPRTRPIPAVREKDPSPSETVATRRGRVRGVCSADGEVEIFAGIPYAQPPVGELRWKPPLEQSWSGTLICDNFRAMSMQPTHLPIYDSLAQIIGYHDYAIRADDNYIAPNREDALYVNLWRPARASGELRPVLVFIHGGSLQTGQTWYADYSGESLAREGVIVVNFGYRLGVFGYFADEELAEESDTHTTGNYGLLDQIAALRWVRENILAFGGDPDNVTLAGESAGAASVSALCTSPLAKGLFRRVILESSTLASKEPPHSFRSLEEALESGREMKERLGVTSIRELRALPAEKLVAEAETQHHICVDGYALTETPYESYRRGVHNEEAILHGYNSAESAPFLLFSQANMKNYEQRIRDYFGDYAEGILALYPAADDNEARAYWAEIYGAVFFDYPHYCLNRLAVENGIPVWEYRFSKSNGRLGPWHSGEMVYFFGNLPERSRLYDERDRELSGQMSGYWLGFVRTGDPNGEGRPFWEQNTLSERLMGFGDETAMIDEGEHALFAVLDEMQGF